ncbi:expressed unknown protein [Seminavis robusta]|uniref:Uncharacterized protein n=1 Tax=Seminavis robusta TaxID=568900 RepID=A0A9N8EKR5_9STRA|nr:expressed unknown protein [Seminavis robusta]|eukprot:Sro1369_g266950.1 n/a (253) ;mRNA; f:20911-21669
MRYPNLFSRKTADGDNNGLKKVAVVSSNDKSRWPHWPVSLRSPRRSSSRKPAITRSESQSMENTSSNTDPLRRRHSNNGQSIVLEDDMSSLSEHSNTQHRNRARDHRQRIRRIRELQRSLPFDVVVPTTEPQPQPQPQLQPEPKEEEPHEMVPTESVDPTRPDLVLESLLATQSNTPPQELDPESRSRLQAIRLLSSMMGPDHPDVLFSMQYLGKHLHRRGNVYGAKAIQNHVHERYHAQTVASLAVTNRCV